MYWTQTHPCTRACAFYTLNRHQPEWRRDTHLWDLMDEAAHELKSVATFSDPPWCLHSLTAFVGVFFWSKLLLLFLNRSAQVFLSMRGFCTSFAQANLSKQVFVITSGRMTFGGLSGVSCHIMWWRWRTGGGKADKGGREDASWRKKKVVFFFICCSWKGFAEHALFQHYLTSYSCTCTCSITWQLPNKVSLQLFFTTGQLYWSQQIGWAAQILFIITVNK